MCPWGVSGSSATKHDPSACRTQTWTYYAFGHKFGGEVVFLFIL